jgi:acylphosphatase
MAQQLKLVGWVRNLPDRTVETVAEGDQTALDEFIQFLRTGSPAADVTAVDIDWQAATSAFDAFNIR